MVKSIIQDFLCTCTCITFLIESFRPYDPTERFYVALGSTVYFITDLVLFKPTKDIILHHGFAIGVIYVACAWPYPHEVYRTISYFEWSTLMLVIMNYARGKALIIAQILFTLSFFNFRIYEVSRVLRLYPLTTIQYVPLLPLCTLNVYWFGIICKKLFKLGRRLIG